MAKAMMKGIRIVAVVVVEEEAIVEIVGNA
jgi:hypothetical protein